MRFPKRLLGTVLLLGALCASFGLFAPATANAQAVATPTPTPTPQAIQIPQMTMIDALHGWAFSSDHKHIYYTHEGPAHWTDVTPSQMSTTTGTSITASFFLNATHGYLGIVQGTQVYLLSTQDSGQTWQETPFNITPINGIVNIHQITFTDPQHGWLTFNRDQRQPGSFDILLMSTSNSGQTWQTLLDTSQNSASLPLPYSQSGTLTFTSPLNGSISGVWLSGSVYLYSTTNGGKTWSPANIAPIKGANSIYFTQTYGPYWQNSHSGTVYVKYDTSDGNGMPHLTAYQTNNGGKSWILGPSSPSTSYVEFYNLSFLNAQQGWSFGFDGQGQFFMHYTSTGGLTWSTFQPTGLLAAQPDYQVVSNLTFVNVLTGWIIIKDAQDNYNLYQTNNSGKSWQLLSPVVS
jgi:photosystem II stability/assembly factor-like uncharacterized protein